MVNTPSPYLPDLCLIGYIKKKQFKQQTIIWIEHYFRQAIAFERDSFFFVEIYKDMFIPCQVTQAKSVDERTMQVVVNDADFIFEPYTLDKKQIYIEKKRLPSYAYADSILMMQDFRLYAGNREIGTIKSEMGAKNNLRMLIVDRKDKEVYVSFHPSLLISISVSEQKVVLDLPSSFVDDL